MVLPILTWGCELLPADEGALGPMAAVQNKQLRTLAGLQETSRQGCPLAMGIELDIPPFYVRAVKTASVHKGADLGHVAKDLGG